MAHTKIGASALLDLVFFLLLCFHVVVAATSGPQQVDDRASTGLSLALIHRDVSANLTHDERFNRLLEHSEARLQWLKSSAATVIRPPSQQIGPFYLVSIRIGTGASQQEYWLDVDTGSALTWIQCVPLNRHFKQEGRVFDPRGSPTYRQVPCSDALCKRDPDYHCVNNFREYTMKYGDGTISNGKLSRETFGFQTDGGRGVYHSITELAFGCSHDTLMKYGNDKSAGILGMNGGPESFAVQLDPISGGLFSYCLVPLLGSKGHAGYLRFGSDIVIRAGTRQQMAMTIDKHYYLPLNDVSLGNKRLGLDKRVFARHAGTGGGGVIIDNGSALGYMVTAAFTRVRLELLEYMKEHNVKPVNPEVGTCFPLKSDIQGILPGMTFHFPGADLKVGGSEMFYNAKDNKLICWAMRDGGPVTLIGAAQQVNKRFVYDLRQKTLLFVDENCAQ